MKRINRPELLDESHIDPAALRGNLQDLARLNRLFGGRALILKTLRALVANHPAGQPLTIVDAGTGSADVPRAIVHWARASGLTARIIACDMHPQVARIARAKCAAYPEIEIVRADVTCLPFAAGSLHIALCSLLLHHLTEAQVRLALSELRRVARQAVIVSDLIRGRLPYWGVKLATSLLSRNPLTRNDGPLSVRRAFTLEEMRRLGVEAGCPDLQLRSVPGFRMLGIAPGTAAHAATPTGARRERDFAIHAAAR
ncbi:MAG: methyltransferase domain-containing protein [Acidobacteria bacterium]|nr:methyltransferase domain-containing protein [Acidobacteriota bacterium]